MRGLFITVEGGDGSGKTTQLGYMREYFAERNIDVLFTREPGGTEIGEKIREIILDPQNGEMAYITEAFLYAAARAQHVEEIISPALKAGRIVVCDRFVDSSIVYQGYGRNLGETVSVINGYAVADCVPDATFLFILSPEESKARMQSKTPDRLELESADFHQKVYEGYLRLQNEFPGRIIGVDASQSEEKIRIQIESYLGRLLNEL